MHLIGHDEQLKQLHTAASSGRLAHAYLFSGLDGIGKKLSALQFTKELFGGDTRVEKNTHPDLFMISAEKKDITIEQVREMQAKVQLHPLEAKYKIVIIDDAEKMNQASANSLLKTLEEPPSATHFFLITSREELLLPTIISRCQRVAFSPLSLADIARLIKENRGIDDETAKRLAEISGGSLSFALSFPLELLNEAFSFSQKLVSGNIKTSELLLAAEKWSKSDVNHAAVLAVIAKTFCQNYLASDLPKSKRKISAIFLAQSDIEATYNKQLLFEQLFFSLAAQ